MPFLTLNTSDSNLAEYYNNVLNGVFAGTTDVPNITRTQKPNLPILQYDTYEDGLIRGGVYNTFLATARDTARVSKFLLGTSGETSVGGFLFYFKQAGLQLTNPRLEWDRSNILPPFLGGPNRQFTEAGILGSTAGAAFGVHLDRGGLLGFIREDQKYAGVTYKNNFEGDDLNNINPSENSYNRLVRYLSKISSASDNSILLDEYLGGASSVYGLGVTRIDTTPEYRTTIRSNDLGFIWGASTFILNSPLASNVSSINSAQQLASLTALLNPGSRIISPGTSPLLSTANLNNIPIAGTSAPISVPFQLINVTYPTNTLVNPDLDLKLNGFIPTTTDTLVNIPGYRGISRKVDPIGYPYYAAANLPSYTIESKYGTANGQDIDAINATNVLPSDIYTSNLKKQNSTVAGTFFTKYGASLTKTLINTGSGTINGEFGQDLITFKIEFLNNDKAPTTSGVNNLPTEVLLFRAYLNDFDDGMSAKWNSYRYMGRGDEFFVYEGFTRDISVSFTMFAHSPQEMQPLYDKLNYLMSAFAPDYSKNNKMRGNIGFLTVGDYIKKAPGVFTSIKISDMLEGGWNTSRYLDGTANNTQFGKELPKMAKIALSFKPIHNFLPQRVYTEDVSIANTRFVNERGSFYKVINPDES